MNPRIKELAKQVGAGFNEGFYREIVGITMSPDKLEKFAELIVKGCITTLDEDDGATHHKELLQDYFGIKE
jgi:hypothetical protein